MFGAEPVGAAMSDHWLHGFNYNVEEWAAVSQHYETLAICRQLAYAQPGGDQVSTPMYLNNSRRVHRQSSERPPHNQILSINILIAPFISSRKISRIASLS
jgi:hypothetical protein